VGNRFEGDEPVSKRLIETCTGLGITLALAFTIGAAGAGLLAPTGAAAQRSPDPVNCQDRCEQAAQEAQRRCEAAGGENCAERASASLAACAARCSTGNVRPAPAPAACADRCSENARTMLRRCEAAGGENCAARAREAYSKCTRLCATNTKPACADRCREHAQALLARCEAAGGENCGTRAREAYNKCAQQCAVREPGGREPGVRPNP
jgi:hypothetical protein